MARVLSVSLLVLLISCKTSESSQVKEKTSKEAILTDSFGLSMNDVSILFPNHQNPQFLMKMPNLSEGFVPEWAGQELANNFENLPTGNKTPPARGRFQADLSPYKLAAMRFDPCPNDLQAKGDDAACFRQMRATWQIQNRELGPFAMDSNVHTAYLLSQDEFSAAMAKLRELHKQASVDTTGLSLSVHPVIQKEGPDSPYLKGVLELLKIYAKPSRLMVMAGLRRADFETWSMTTLSQDLKTQTISERPLIGVENSGMNIKVQTFSANRQRSSSFLMVRPASANPKNISKEVRDSVPNAVAFENPKLHNALSTDCSSCHQAVHLSMHPDLNVPPLDLAEVRYASQYPSSVTIFEARDFTALQMFSFSSGRPRITPRVVNETANVLDYMKSHGL